MSDKTKINRRVQHFSFLTPKRELVDIVKSREGVLVEWSRNQEVLSLKALDDGYSSKNYVKKFLRALHPKWRAKKDSEIVKAKVERKSLALKATKESNDEECSTSSSEDEERTTRSRDDKTGKIMRKCFRCGDPNYLIGECPKPPKDKNQKAFVGGSWSDSGEEDDKKVEDETCLVSHASSKTNNNGVDLECAKMCHAHNLVNEKLKDESTRLNKFEKSTHCLNEMLSNQKPSGDKLGLGFNSFEASSSGTKEIKFVKAQKKAKIEESLNVTFDETPPSSKTSPLVDDDLDGEEAIREIEKKNLENDVEDETLEIDEIVNIKESMNHPLENVIGKPYPKHFV
ncbi:hypothetical protein Tco_0501934 [Tanacetum coccineum]